MIYQAYKIRNFCFCLANLLPILNFSCKRWWLSRILLLLFLSTFANLVEGLFSGIFYVTLEIDMIMPQWRLGYDILEVGLAPPKELIVNYNLTCGCQSRQGSSGADGLVGTCTYRSGCRLKNVRVLHWQGVGTQSGLFQKRAADLGPHYLSLLFTYYFIFF